MMFSFRGGLLFLSDRLFEIFDVLVGLRPLSGKRYDPWVVKGYSRPEQIAGLVRQVLGSRYGLVQLLLVVL